jgi:hypothetical protein
MMVTRKLGVEKQEHALGFTFKLAAGEPAALISPRLPPRRWLNATGFAAPACHAIQRLQTRASITFRIGITCWALLLAACAMAESPDERGNYLVNTIMPREGAPDGSPASIAANITSDPTAGIGGWTDQESGCTIAHGIARDGRMLKPPMEYGYYGAEGSRSGRYRRLSACLRTVPPLH